MKPNLAWSGAAVGLAIAIWAPPAMTGKSTGTNSRELFERRILPLFRSPNPSSCSECHLSGVDLKDYIRPSEADTYAALRRQGLVDPARPADSKILKLIQMKQPESALLTQKARQLELEAFGDWLQAAASNRELKSASIVAVGPIVSTEVVRHTRIDRVLDSFTRNIWSQEGRCMSCHRDGAPESAKLAAKHGERVRWFVPGNPGATMERVLKQKLVDVEHPQESLMLLKPTNQVAHGGGVKFVKGDRTYRMFLTWIEDYARSVKGAYRTSSELPAPQQTGLAYTGSIMEIHDAPRDWIDRSVRADFFPWDQDKGQFGTRPTATADRLVGPNRATNLLIYRVFEARSIREKEAWKGTNLPPGKYLVKYYLVSTDLIKAGEDHFVGSQEVDSEWKQGWGGITKVRFQTNIKD